MIILPVRKMMLAGTVWFDGGRGEVQPRGGGGGGEALVISQVKRKYVLPCKYQRKP